MKSPPNPPRGVRILIVEDEEETVRTLTYELQKALLDPEIHSAGTVADAEKKLKASLDASRPYDVAILDFKLPPDYPGQNPEPDHSLGLAFRDDSPETLIIHDTAYKDDPGFRAYLRYRDAPAEMGRLFIAKEKGWMELLPKEIIRALPLYRIRRKFDALFRRHQGPQNQRSGQRRWGVGRSNRERTLAIAELCADASQHWEYLNESLQNDLKRTLGYAADDKGHHFVGVAERSTKDEAGENEEEL